MFISGIKGEAREARRLGKDVLAYMQKTTRDRDARLKAMVNEMKADSNVLMLLR